MAMLYVLARTWRADAIWLRSFERVNMVSLVVLSAAWKSSVRVSMTTSFMGLVDDFLVLMKLGRVLARTWCRTLILLIESAWTLFRLTFEDMDGWFSDIWLRREVGSWAEVVR